MKIAIVFENIIVAVKQQLLNNTILFYTQKFTC